MTSPRDPLDALEDILENLTLAREFGIDHASVDDLARDTKSLYSIVRALEVVGEATKRVPEAVRDRDRTIPWKEMAGMRDKLIHAYESVDVELVFKTLRQRIPEVEPRVRSLLEAMKAEPPESRS